MKKIIITCCLVLSFVLQPAFAQEYRTGNTAGSYSYIDSEPYLAGEFKVSGFTGGFAKKINENTYWVKNAMFNLSADKVVDFGLYLKLNHTDVIDQVPAVNGYVVQVNEKTLNIWIASETGTPASDEIEINYNE